MNEKEYFERSKKENLPGRCPLIGRCERYAITIYYLSELDKHGTSRNMKEELISNGYTSKKNWKIMEPQIGGSFEFGSNSYTGDFAKACPEVPLFHREIFSEIPHKAITSGDWDYERPEHRFGNDKRFRIRETKHYSECLEFTTYAFHNNNSNMPMVLDEWKSDLLLNKTNPPIGTLSSLIMKDGCDSRDSRVGVAPGQNAKDDIESVGELELTPTRETVVNILDPFSEAFIGNGAFERVINVVCKYFDEKTPVNSEPIKVRRGNTKKLAKALKEIHQDIFHKDPIGRDYLNFTKATFDCYSNCDNTKERLSACTLYKYMSG